MTFSHPKLGKFEFPREKSGENNPFFPENSSKYVENVTQQHGYKYQPLKNHKFSKSRKNYKFSVLKPKNSGFQKQSGEENNDFFPDTFHSHKIENYTTRYYYNTSSQRGKNGNRGAIRAKTPTNFPRNEHVTSHQSCLVKVTVQSQTEKMFCVRCARRFHNSDTCNATTNTYGCPLNL